MRINLNDISKSGQTFTFTKSSGELNASLKDLVGDNEYQVQFEILPKPHGYELTGQVKTYIPDVCSFCGHEMDATADITLKELLLPEVEQPRSSHYTKPNHFSDLHSNHPSVTFYKDSHFEAGDYFHEIIALEQPIQPSCPSADKQACDDRAEEVRKLYGEEKTSPFADLKQLKLN